MENLASGSENAVVSDLMNYSAKDSFLLRRTSLLLALERVEYRRELLAGLDAVGARHHGPT
jgi:hypothetical protein